MRNWGHQGERPSPPSPHRKSFRECPQNLKFRPVSLGKPLRRALLLPDLLHYRRNALNHKPVPKKRTQDQEHQKIDLFGVECLIGCNPVHHIMDLEGWTKHPLLRLLGREIERIHPLLNGQTDLDLHVCFRFLVLCYSPSPSHWLVHEECSLLSSRTFHPIIAILRAVCICSGRCSPVLSHFTGAYGSLFR